jgi:hypothetical protein
MCIDRVVCGRADSFRWFYRQCSAGLDSDQLEAGRGEEDVYLFAFCGRKIKSKRIFALHSLFRECIKRSICKNHSMGI